MVIVRGMSKHRPPVFFINTEKQNQRSLTLTEFRRQGKLPRVLPMLVTTRPQGISPPATGKSSSSFLSPTTLSTLHTCLLLRWSTLSMPPRCLPLPPPPSFLSPSPHQRSTPLNPSLDSTSLPHAAPSNTYSTSRPQSVTASTYCHIPTRPHHPTPLALLLPPV